MKTIIKLLFTPFLITSCSLTKKNQAKAENSSSNNDYIVFEDRKNEKFLPENKKRVFNTQKANEYDAMYVSTSEGVEDKAFNERSWSGLLKYLGDERKYVQKASSMEKDKLVETYQKAFEKTSLLVVSGSWHKKAVKEVLPKTKDKYFVYIDSNLENNNVMAFDFKMEEAAFFAGYLAAKTLSDESYAYDSDKSPGLKIGAFGHQNDYNTLRYMAGFQQGIYYWNNNLIDQDKKINFISLDKKENYFYKSSEKSSVKDITSKLLDKGADIILAATYDKTLDALKTIKSKKANTLLVGVDVDQSKKYEDYDKYFLTSIVKNVGLAAHSGVEHIYDVSRRDIYGFGKVVVGNMENDLTRLAYDGYSALSYKQYLELREDEKLAKAAKEVKIKFKI